MIGNIVKPGDKIDIKYLHQDNDKIYMRGNEYDKSNVCMFRKHM